MTTKFDNLGIEELLNNQSKLSDAYSKADNNEDKENILFELAKTANKIMSIAKSKLSYGSAIERRI